MLVIMKVYSFTDALMDAVLQFGTSSKSEDVATARNISTQCPALLQAVEVMVEQCQKRFVFCPLTHSTVHTVQT